MTISKHHSDSVIAVAGMTQKFPQANGELQPVLRDVSFEIKRGSFTIIHGPSGSGKSSLLNIVIGLIPPTSGKVSINGQELYAMTSDERAHFRGSTIGMVHQTNYWVKSLSVLDNVALPLFLTGVPRPEAHQAARQMLASVGLSEYADYSPTVLSGGQQQRVSIARALVTRPMLLVADEPTGNLDSKNGDMIMKLLDSMRKDNKCTVLLVTHDLKYLPMADQELAITDGVVTEHKRGRS